MSPTVLITGTSSGIGRACAEEIAGRGWRVLAGVRREEDGEEVRGLAPDRIEPLMLDVTDLDAIAALPERVGGSLDGLVNNAGMANAGPLEHLPVEDIRHQLDVMLLAPFALTKVDIEPPREVIGRSTQAAIQSGLVYGFAGQVDGILKRVRGEIPEIKAIGTGGLASTIAPFCEELEDVDDLLTLTGLRILWERNTG